MPRIGRSSQEYNGRSLGANFNHAYLPWRNQTLRATGVRSMTKKPKFKKNRGNYYKHDSEFAEEVLKINERHNPYPIQKEIGVKDR
jgi:hypothetical protein